MDRKDLESLKVGDTVQIHFTRMMSRGPRGEPFNVVVDKIRSTGKAYKEDDGRYYESRQISWRWADMPIELQPDKAVRDDVRGLDTCHEDHITAIIERAPYRVQPQTRNVMYALEQGAFADHVKIEDYRRSKGERVLGWGNKISAVGFVFDVYNETYKRDVKKGQYNGHIFTFARAIIARRPGLTVPEQIDADRFLAAWNKAGRPGCVGPFLEMSRSSIWDDADEGTTRSSPYKALLNRKAFTNWVVRNVSRFVMTKDQILKNMIKNAEDDDRYFDEEDRRETAKFLANVPDEVDASDEDEDQGPPDALRDIEDDYYYS